MSAFAQSTERVQLGTTQVVKLRSPLVMAQTAATLDELSGGRLVMVLGSYTAKHAARNGIPVSDPLATLREYVEVIRALIRGERVSVEGNAISMEGASLNFTPVRDRVPIWIAATTRRGLLNAGAIGDGVLLDAGASPAYAANAVAVVRQGAEQAGRDPDELTVAQLVNVSVDPDPEVASEAIRWEVASKFRYPSTPRAKMSVGEPAIDPADLPEFADAFNRGGMPALRNVLSDTYIRELTATGTPEHVQSRLTEYRAAGVHLPLVRPAAPHQLELLLETVAGSLSQS